MSDRANSPAVTSPGLSTYAADVLFIVQILGGFGLMIPMMVRNWTNVEGVSASFFIVLLAFLALQLSLAIPAHKAQPSRKSLQTIIIYAAWVVLIGFHLIEILCRGLYQWDLNDAVTSILTFGGAGIVYVLRRARGSDFSDPVTKSQLGMMTRGVPQLLQGVKIWMIGGGGLHGFSVLIGNVNIWVRMIHLLLTHNEATWDKHRRWMLASEVVNAVSWGIVSLIWLAWHLGIL